MARVQARHSTQRMARLRHLHAGDLRAVVPDADGDAPPQPTRHHGRRQLPQQAEDGVDGDGALRGGLHALDGCVQHAVLVGADEPVVRARDLPHQVDAGEASHGRGA